MTRRSPTAPASPGTSAATSSGAPTAKGQLDQFMDSTEVEVFESPSC